MPEAVGAPHYDAGRVRFFEEVANGYRRPGVSSIKNSKDKAVVYSFHLFSFDGAGYIAGYHLRLEMGKDAGLG